MNPSARLQAALELLDAVLSDTSHPADATVSGYFRARRYIGSGDRAEVATQVYTIIRHRARLNWWCEKYQAESVARNFLMAYLVLAGKKADTINIMFSGGKFAPAALITQELAFLRRLEGHTLRHPDMEEAVALECPEWAEGGLRTRFGEDFAREMTALLTTAPLDLRINHLRTTRSETLAALQAAGLTAQECAYSPFGIRVEKRPDLNRIPLLKDGRVEIQDEGSQLVSLLVDPRPGDRVIDFCAGAGGKTLALAALMDNRGHITACDVMERRLKRGAERIRHAGFHNVDCRLLANTNDPWVKKHKGSADRVIVDAPCSGTGTWRRNPDARWRHVGMEPLIALQAEILESAARLVKSGGRLVYATCSFLPEENEDQITRFLAANPDFILVSAREALAGITTHSVVIPDGTDQCLRLSPARHGTDGFFAAVMQRTAS